MSEQEKSALIRATAIGTVLQLLMVVSGHYTAAIASLFAVGGMLFSLIAGLLYAMWARQREKGRAGLLGMVAGAVCGFIGIVISLLLGDVQPILLLMGTVSSAVTGAIGGLIGAVALGRPTVKI